jgi:hypothetical protein
MLSLPYTLRLTLFIRRLNRVPFQHFSRGEKGKIFTRDTAEKAEKNGLKFELNNYTICAISIGFASSGFPRKTSKTAEMG